MLAWMLVIVLAVVITTTKTVLGILAIVLAISQTVIRDV